MVTYAAIDPSNYYVPEDVNYLDVHNILPLFNKIAFKVNVILTGETGIAKSMAFVKFAKITNVPLIVHWCSEDQRREHLIGHLTFEGKETIYHLGALAKAVRIANQVGKAILLLEELNGLTPQTQKLLNPLTDWHREIETDYGFERLDKKAQLWVVGAMNIAGYGGVFALNDDLKSRFRIIPLSYAKAEAEKAMVKSQVPTADPKMIDKVITLAELSRANSLDYKLSPRDVVDIINDAELCGLGEALRMQSGKFEGDDRDTYVEWIKSTFTKEMLVSKKSP